MLTGLNWQDGDANISWFKDGDSVSRHFPHALRSAVFLRDGSGVAVVLEVPRGSFDAAIIVNSDGSDRAAVKIPGLPSDSTYFDQMYYVGDNLTLFINTRGTDWAFEIDEHTGTTLRSYESR